MFRPVRVAVIHCDIGTVLAHLRGLRRTAGGPDDENALTTQVLDEQCADATGGGEDEDCVADRIDGAGDLPSRERVEVRVADGVPRSRRVGSSS